MASEASKEDRQLPASEKRLRNAREEGRVPRSRELTHLAVLGVSLSTVTLLGPTLMQSMMQMIRTGLRFERADAFTPERVVTLFGTLMSDALMVVLPVAAATAVAVIAASVVPGGMVLSAKPMMPKASKLSPLGGLKRIFSLRGGVDLLKLMTVACTVLAIGAWYLMGSIPRVASLSSLTPAEGFADGSWVIVQGAAWMVGVIAIIALFDVPFQWFRHRADLKMTREEAKQEHKESDGDPHVRARIRQRQREAATRRMLTAVPAADVVVTNPTHFAVAIRYDDSKMGAPRVVAKGADLVAARIREVARANSVPLFEAPPLARALYTHVELDREIPAALYTAVAQVLAYIYQLRNWVPGRGIVPHAPDAVPVPPGMDPATASGAQPR